MGISMSVFSQFTTGTGGSIPALVQAFNSSTTFVPGISGYYGILVVGAGGGGGSIGSYTNGYNYSYRAQGGSAGGTSVKIAYLTSGSSIVITIGAGGSAGYEQAGGSGSITTVIGGGVSITCNAGQGGATSSSTNLAARAGGNGVGGDLNWTGGGAPAQNGTAPQGGCSVGFFGTGYASNGWYGAGTGRAGDSSYPGGAYGYVQYGGNQTSTAPALGEQLIAPPVIFGISMNGQGSTTSNAIKAIGVGGLGGPSNSSSIAASPGGMFAGGGSAQVSYFNQPNLNAAGGAGGKGGGGGSATAFGGYSGYTAGQIFGGSGGAGFVQIGFLGQ
jgi:hypothetical protein